MRRRRKEMLAVVGKAVRRDCVNAGGASGAQARRVRTVSDRRCPRGRRGDVGDQGRVLGGFRRHIRGKAALSPAAIGSSSSVSRARAQQHDLRRLVPHVAREGHAARLDQRATRRLKKERASHGEADRVSAARVVLANGQDGLRSFSSFAGASTAQSAVTVEPSDRVNTKSDASTVEVRTCEENDTTIPSPGPWKLVQPSWS